MSRQVTLEEMKIMWAASELGSARTYGLYQGSPSIREDLIKAWHLARGKYLGHYLDNVTGFKIEEWTLDDIATVLVLPELTGIKYIALSDYIAQPIPYSDNTDPRFAADMAISQGKTFTPGPPVTIGLMHSKRILIDGYTRSIIFLKSPGPYTKIQVLNPISRNP